MVNKKHNKNRYFIKPRLFFMVPPFLSSFNMCIKLATYDFWGFYCNQIYHFKKSRNINRVIYKILTDLNSYVKYQAYSEYFLPNG